ncbi:Gfo/Idh/MocA family protein [Virgibacillus kekensis]|uniref:Gfo/Idh/MocA family protein n=1 Tax=Virgibacillus kekensis TaxID=202261 RepID=A0ABV9DFS8_9BACI
MKLGTIGTGWITSQFIEAVKETGVFKVLAVYSRTEQKANQFANRQGAENFYTDLEEMANSTLIDTVYIASPNSLHYDHALMFLKKQKNVICEKPIFSNIAELENAYKVAEENGVYLFEAIKNIHLPNFDCLKKNLEKVGNVRSAVLHRIRYSSRYNEYLDGKIPNIFSPDYSGGALVDLGIYPLSAAVALFGMPEYFTYFPVILSSGVDGGGTLVLTYKDFTCTIICSKITTSYMASEIHGEKGTISIDDTGTLSRLSFIDIHSAHREDFGIYQNENEMVYEVQQIAEIINTKNHKKYSALRELSHDVLSIMEEARKRNGIIYSSEQ